MYNHEPANYICPFCLVAQGVENDHVRTKKQDVFYKDKNVTAFISSDGWVNNPGHVIIIPNGHFENIYDLPDNLNHNIADLTKKVAIAFKEIYQCSGTSTRQHNEPEGGQDVWHYHVHVFPRYKDDKLYELINERKLSPEEDRKSYADKLKKYFATKG